MQKENEIKELKKRLDHKFEIDEKSKDRDNSIFTKFLGRKPVSTNAQDQKLVTILNHYENQREKLERECEKLQTQINNYRTQVENFNACKNEIATQSKGNHLQSEKVQQELRD